MESNRINKKILLGRQPPEWPETLLPMIRRQVKQSGLTIVVLDDDPTGTQTVYNIPVLTSWSIEILEHEFQQKPDLFYILTNSRSLTASDAQKLNIDIGKNLVIASKKNKRPFVVVSRSDSTLRGHFPEEIDALVSVIEQDVDGYLIVPYFLEGGRLTIDDIHWVEENEWLIPANETPFAKDSYFGYSTANLKSWIEEKTKGKVKAGDVISISIDDIRIGGPGKVSDKLIQMEKGAVCIVNSITLRDMEVFVHALLDAENKGKRFLYRTAASFVQIRAGISTRELLNPNEISNKDNVGGLFIVGSYVPKSTKQLEFLIENTSIFPIAVNLDTYKEDESLKMEIQRVINLTEKNIKNGTDVVIYTSRKLIQGMDSVANLDIASRVSSILVSIMSGIRTRPRFLVAKGGITSSDIATKALNIKRAMVMGQILPGVPVWKTGKESLFPDIMYVVFPGNVGNVFALAEILEKLSIDSKSKSKGILCSMDKEKKFYK